MKTDVFESLDEESGSHLHLPFIRPAYKYDKVGNRLAKIDNPTSQPTDTYSYYPGTDKLSQVSGSGDREYDLNGNAIGAAGTGTIFGYDRIPGRL